MWTVLLVFLRTVAKASVTFEETLQFHPIDNGLILAHFKFVQTIPKASINSHNRLIDYETFPPEIAEITEDFGIGEMRLSFGKGRWNQRTWGIAPFDLAATGIQLHAWIQDGSDSSVDAKWDGLLSALSGLFGGSIGLLSEAKTAQPVIAFRPHNPNLVTDHKLRFGILPRETVCTENLTPWLKLLPCMGNAGLASLINPVRVYDSRYNLMDLAIKTRPNGKLELTQSLAIVWDLRRWKKIPDWSLSSLFDRVVHSVCPACPEPTIRLHIDDELAYLVDSDHDPKIISAHDNERVVEYGAEAIVDLDIGLTFSSRKDFPAGTLPESHLVVQRFITGVGQESGSLRITIQNIHHDDGSDGEGGDTEIVAKHLEVLPWYMRVYLHTLKATLNDGQPWEAFRQFHYSPSIDRVKPAQIEFEMRIPENSTLTLELQFDMTLLRYTEYPLDPNRGVDVNGAILTYADPVTKLPRQLATDTLLLTLPTPDFTMPFNVIMLTSMGLTIFYGQIFNLITRKFRLRDPSTPSGPLEKLRAMLVSGAQRVSNFFRKRVLRK